MILDWSAGIVVFSWSMVSYHHSNTLCKGLAACAMPAQRSATLCCVTLCAPHCACRHTGKVQQCLLGQQHFGIGYLDWY